MMHNYVCIAIHHVDMVYLIPTETHWNLFVFLNVIKN